MTSREQAKNRRRRQITDAARALLRGGETGFTMRNLAETAGVSIATPYNLFGSKQAVMFAVLETDLARYGRELARQDLDGIERLFHAVSLARAGYADDPDYHRAVLFAAYNDGGREYRSLFAGTGHAIWRDMVTAAVDAGQLRPELDPDAFAATLEHMMFSCVLEWVRGELSLEELELRAHYGFALVLLGMCEPQVRSGLETRALQAQQQLTALWKQRSETATTAVGCDAVR